jgi:hypothetical protein
MNELTERPANPFTSAPVVAAPTNGLVSVEQQRAMAEVQAAMVVARANPRDAIKAMDLILADCMRPTLADSAVYEYSRGGSAVSGPSIRLAESIARRWGNLECGVKELSRHNGYSECIAYAWDLETNFRDAKVFQVKHWRDTKKGGYAITDERDIYELVANMGARRKRACILAVIPGDVTEAAVKQCEATLRTKVEITEELLQSTLDAFANYGVTKEQLEKRIQRRFDTVQPAQLMNLRKIYNSLRDGMSTAADWFEVTEAPNADDPAPASKTEAVKEKMRSKSAAKPEADAGPTDWQKVTGAMNRARESKDIETRALIIDEVRDLIEKLPDSQRHAAEEEVAELMKPAE